MKNEKFEKIIKKMDKTINYLAYRYQNAEAGYEFQDVKQEIHMKLFLTLESYKGKKEKLEDYFFVCSKRMLSDMNKKHSRRKNIESKYINEFISSGKYFYEDSLSVEEKIDMEIIYEKYPVIGQVIDLLNVGLYSRQIRYALRMGSEKFEKIINDFQEEFNA